ncbi:MAG: hypothetical protein KDA63_06135 [Planctomycetales bacterium]|nr:hypothetical protein [Planctomycetales bacterium]
MPEAVTITFDCVPLRSVLSREIPEDASPKFRARCERLLAAIDEHGVHNTYFLHSATCEFHLTNSKSLGMLQFSFEGTVFTDQSDLKTVRSDLAIELTKETCPWLTEPAVQWFAKTVEQAVIVEFDRFITAGDLERTIQRHEQLKAQSDQQSGYIGMYL